MPRRLGLARWVWQSWPCELCGAAPGKPCITETGKTKNEPHAIRAAVASAHHWHTPEDWPEQGADDGP